MAGPVLIVIALLLLPALQWVPERMRLTSAAEAPA
jgi:hypothetical protein